MKTRIQNLAASSQKSETGSGQVSAFRFPLSALPNRRGMALVITLIMLSVTLVMAIAFLAIARRERISVSTSTDSTVARLASDTALAAAQAQMLANIQSSNAALYNYNLLVSTNYINPSGFDNTLVTYPVLPNNVSYNYPNGNLVGGVDFAQVVANLQFLPRAPVLVSPAEPVGRFYLDLNRNGAFEDTGDGVANALLVAGSFVNGNQVNGTVTTNGTFPGLVGDPQWVGVLERPGLPHAADNQFVSRYSFIALPVGESLDLNYLHNQAATETVKPASGGNDGFFRDQSVGSWELNLAAFLADLNTNQWLRAAPPANVYYAYNEPFSINRGLAFDDALALLSWRYNYVYNNLNSVSQLFLSPNYNYLTQDNVDFYDRGQLLQTTTTNIVESGPAIDPVNNSWPGSDNPNKFYTPADFFDPAKSSGGVNSFTNRLSNGGTTAAANGAQPAYDRYTFYRMLDQLGTDSLPGNAGKLNLNYQNALVNYGANGEFLNATIVPGMETNLFAWNPRNFFCAAADMMLKVYTTNWFQANPSNYLATYYGIVPNFANYYYTDRNGNTVTNDPTGFGLTNIPFLGMTNQVPAFGLANIPAQVNGNFVYSSAVNRLLQLTANIFDAGTNDFYPDVFRPIFYHKPTSLDVFVVGYTNVDSVPGGINDPQVKTVYDMTAVVNGVVPMVNGYFTENVYGLPWIIGAKKYLPNFNEFYSFNTLQVSRKLQFSRKSAPSNWPGSSGNPYATNQMLVVSITNHMGFSFWNSYAANYNNPYNNPQLFVHASDFIRMRLSYGGYTYTAFTNFTFSQAPNPWNGSAWSLSSPPRTFNDSRSFIAGNFDFPFVQESALDLDNLGNMNGFTSEAFNTTVKAVNPFPAFEQDTTNWFQAFIFDSTPAGVKILDYVQFAGPVQVRNLGDDLRDPNYNSGGQTALMWSTNSTGAGTPPNGVNWGVQNQINIAQSGNISSSFWKSPPNMPSGLTGIKGAEAAMFKGFFTLSWSYTNAGLPKTYFNTNLIQQAPYTPTRTVISPTLWVVNDPLVHYLTSDLVQPLDEVNNVTNGVAKSDDPSTPPIKSPTLNYPADRYQPWGRNNAMENVTGVLHNNPENASYNLSYRDPLVYGSDNWDFPANKYPSVGWLGRVHRGTPWQTVYLKATNLLNYVNTAQGNVGITTWKYWTGDFNDFDSLNSRPIQDELLFDVFTAAPNDNAARGTLSVNQKHLAAWSAVFGGLLTISNASQTASGYPDYSTSPSQTNVVIDPAGVDQANSTLYQIVDGANGINATRANYFGNNGFQHMGQILRTPALTQTSPFLNRNDAYNPNDRVNSDVSDEMYEWLPQQIMGLLRPSGAPRFVVYAYGQTLKPAPDGTVLSSSTLPSGYNPFGLVTNYQVVAESATRAIITVQPVLTNVVVTVPGTPPYQTVIPVTNYTTKVESFNVLPP